MASKSHSKHWRIKVLPGSGATRVKSERAALRILYGYAERLYHDRQKERPTMLLLSVVVEVNEDDTWEVFRNMTADELVKLHEDRLVG